ncbi:aldo/keto reductase [Nonomuraea sp. FMUSA5-5]|uniref:Aldo/keto reductase n=1 Tax=Nonomuraea composti TaxID=2720023 RepID=A0ABX1B3T6_9ACTN|nr:aldo/keto reductase [Nonomuraea sp. FMUSA5-5]NJP90989.1 aldo/keto reductase [Nonomuraea sp. FMUSA5-5]
MRTRPLGRTGIQVSPYCLGTMMFGGAGNPDHDGCVRIIHRALDAGINVIDTADVYAGSESEEIVGRALRGRRDDVVLATKVNGRMGEDPNRAGSSRRWIVAGVEHSLRRLRTDHIDLYQIHHPDPRTDVEETLAALTDLMAGAGTVLGDDLLDRIDEIVPPGADVGPLDVAYDPPAVTTAALRRRAISERAAA